MAIFLKMKMVDNRKHRYLKCKEWWARPLSTDIAVIKKWLKCCRWRHLYTSDAHNERFSFFEKVCSSFSPVYFEWPLTVGKTFKNKKRREKVQKKLFIFMERICPLNRIHFVCVCVSEYRTISFYVLNLVLSVALEITNNIQYLL